MLKALFILFTIFIFSAFSCSSNDKSKEARNPSSKSAALSDQWHERGIKAKENLDNIGQRNSTSFKCIKDFERAFYYHAIPEHSALLKGVQPMGTIYSFSIAHVSELSRDQRYLKVTLVNFYYDLEENLFKVDVPILASGWRIQMSEKSPHGFMLDNNKCYYFINISDPFESQVLSIPSDQDV